MPSEPTPSYPKNFAQRTVPPSAAFATAQSGVKTDSTPIPKNGSRLSILIFPNGPDPITVEIRDAAGTGWIAAAPSVSPGQSYYDNEYDGEIRVTGTDLNYTVVEI
jgi:hypothetical protein